MSYSEEKFHKDVFTSIKKVKGSDPTQEECMAIAHHMEYNIRADRNYANNGHLIISPNKLRLMIVEQIRNNLHNNDIPRYIQQYKAYKNWQKNWKLSTQEKDDLSAIATGKKKVSDFSNKDYLKRLYMKYFNQKILPTIRNISWQEKNNLGYHGLWHTEQVAMFAIDISIEENMNPLPNLLAAALHDCARKSDYGDKDHGINCVPIARDYLDNMYQDAHLLTPIDKFKIIHAVKNHNIPPEDKNNTVLNCLQDADSMRLWWEMDQKHKPNTVTGKKLSEYRHNRWQQIKYMARMLEIMRSAMQPHSARSNTKPPFSNTQSVNRR